MHLRHRYLRRPCRSRQQKQRGQQLRVQQFPLLLLWRECSNPRGSIHHPLWRRGISRRHKWAQGCTLCARCHRSGFKGCGPGQACLRPLLPALTHHHPCLRLSPSFWIRDWQLPRGNSLLENSGLHLEDFYKPWDGLTAPTYYLQECCCLAFATQLRAWLPVCAWQQVSL